MSEATSADPTGGSGLLAELMAAVRTEFRVELLIPAPGELIFNMAECQVPGCPRQPRSRRLCSGHYSRWQARGGPDYEEFLADPGPAPTGRISLTPCTVRGCRFGAMSQGLCVSHHGFWQRAGQPERAAWLTAAPAVAQDGHLACRLSFCTLWTQGNSPLCHNHKSRWYGLGRPDIDEFVRRCETSGDDRFDFAPLRQAHQLRLELQYALQCRHDERKSNTNALTVAPVIRLAAASGVDSLLDWPMTRWAEHFAATKAGSSHHHG